MGRRYHWGMLAVITVMMLVISAVPGQAAFDKEILQAVHSGIPNVGNNRVVVAELTAGDW
jgi:hypothetical protein